MPKSNAAAKAGEVLSDLRSRLGFSREDAGHGGYDGLGEYDDFDDDGFNERDDREYAGYGADYDDKAPVGAYRPATAGSGRFGRSGSTPDLVSIDDVKARTQVPDSLRRDPLAAGGPARPARQPGGRELVGNTGPAHSSPAYNAQVRERDPRSRSEGLDSLFEPTDGAPGAARPAGGYDPYEAYSGSAPAPYRTSRGVTVIRPAAYADVEQVSRALKAGDVVVLAMRATPDDLSKRVLDFSFGVASALDANVECPGEKVFAIARGNALTEVEKLDLRTKGVL